MPRTPSPKYTTVPFLDLFWPAETGSADAVADRLIRHAKALKAARLPDYDLDEAWIELDRRTQKRIWACAHRYVECRDADPRAADTLDRKDRKALERVRDGVRLVAIHSEHRADEIASELHFAMPWMAEATERVWHGMRTSVREGAPGLRLPPVLLVGPPGVGKSHWARRLAELIDTPAVLIDATGESASFGVVGCQRGWGTARAGRPVEQIIAHRIGNPTVIIDEIEKAGRPTSRGGRAWSLPEALLPLLERSTARTWSCPFYRVTMDMSWIGWVLTANDLDGLPEPLLSRVAPIRIPPLTNSQLIEFARQQVAAAGLDDALVDGIAETIEMASAHRRPSLRTIIRMVESARTVLHSPVLH
ncbi:AAA family ATPase [Jannaschia marina]|uniref:AAA family ATPase n=1 Tax=Jannaschia marina TaxID=2741674 RepID=UPI0015C9137B|nr:AAA family ATPase [Jannaschia marina]